MLSRFANRVRPDPRLANAIAEEERAGLAFAFWIRAAALATIAVWLAVIVPMPRVLYWEGLILLFLVSGLAPFLMRRRRAWRLWKYAFLAFDACLLTVALLLPNPLDDTLWPPQMQLRFHNQLYLFVFLAGAALNYSATIVLWTGAALAAAWSLGVYLILRLPGSLVGFPESDGVDPALASQQALERILDPQFVNVTVWMNEVVLLLIAAMIIAAAVWRAKRLLRRQIESERARANLARYFSPNLVESLAADRTALDDSVERKVAVLFVDIVAFTQLSEQLPPARVIALLRSFHRRMARCVFDHGGTLDKYMGDQVMATFGTLGAGPSDASQALRCAQAMLSEVEAWNRKRAARDAPRIEIGIGVHYGPVIVGNVGEERHLEFTTVGDTVNCASRLERLTRERSVPLLVSDALLDAARDEAALPQEAFARFRADGRIALRGRNQETGLWRFDPEGASASSAA